MVEHRGGVQIGCFHATWPFAHLTVEPGQLKIKVPWSGELSFFPGQVVRMERVGDLPFIHRGIRIVHTIGKYPETIIFRCFSDPGTVIGRIHDEGFQPQGAAEDMPRRRRDFPLTGKAIVAVIAIWNIPLLFARLGVASLLGVALLFAGALALSRSARLQSFVLKPGRNTDEIRDVLMVVKSVTAVLLVLFGLLMLTGIF